MVSYEMQKPCRRKRPRVNLIVPNVPFFVAELRLDRLAEGVLELSFDELTLEPYSTVDSANIRMLVQSVESDTIRRVKIYGISSNEKRRRRFLADSREVYLTERYPKWLEFDVTKVLRHWQRDSTARQVRVEVHCVRCFEDGVLFLPVLPTVLNVLVNSPGKDRDRRSVEQYFKNDRKTDCTEGNKRCCRQEMVFDIGKLKEFDFIIQPKKFDAGVCRGRCPPTYNAAHNHAVFQGLLWKRNKNLIPRVCCAPSKLESLEILTIDEDDPTKLKVRDFEKMIVTECWCS